MRIAVLFVAAVSLGLSASASAGCPKKPAVETVQDPFGGVSRKSITTWLGPVSVVGDKISVAFSFRFPNVVKYVLPGGWFQEYALADGRRVRLTLAGDVVPVHARVGDLVFTTYAGTFSGTPDDLRALASSRVTAARSVALSHLSVLAEPSIPDDAWMIQDFSTDEKGRERKREEMACAVEKLGL